MNLQDERDRLASNIAYCGLEGKQLAVCEIAAALNLGLDVEAIQSDPHSHLIFEEDTHG